MEDKRCSCGSSRRPDKSKWSHALKLRPTHSAAAVVTQLFPGCVFSNVCRQAEGEALLAFSSSKKKKEKRKGKGGTSGGNKAMSIIPYELSVGLVSDDNVVALGENWDVLQCAGHGKSDSLLSYPKEFPFWKCTEMNGCRWQIKMSPRLFYFSTFNLLQM